jgi:hypothetical protein
MCTKSPLETIDPSLLASLPWTEPEVPHLPLRYRQPRYRMAPPTFTLPEATEEEVALLLHALDRDQ